MGLHYRLSEEQFPLTASKSPAADHTPPWHPSPAWPLSPPAPSSVSRLPVLPLGLSSPPPARGRTLTAPPSSSELVPLPLESLDPELVLAQCSARSSLAMPGTPASSSNSSPMPFLDSPCPRPWVCSV